MKKQSINALKERVDELQAEITCCEGQIAEYQAEIVRLERELWTRSYSGK